MGGFLSFNSPLMRFMSKVTDLIILNLIFIFFSLPLFTIGSSMTALYYVALKMADNTEGSIPKQFFNSFKSNFKQATVIWLIIVAAVMVFWIDISAFIRNQEHYASPVKIIVFIFGIVLVVTALQVFAVLAKFDNTIGQTIKNALVIALTQLIKSIAILAFWLLPIAAVIINLRLLPVIITVGFSAPAYLSSLLLNSTFDKILNPEPLPERKYKDPFDDDDDEDDDDEDTDVNNEDETSENEVSESKVSEHEVNAKETDGNIDVINTAKENKNSEEKDG